MPSRRRRRGPPGGGGRGTRGSRAQSRRRHRTLALSPGPLPPTHLTPRSFFFTKEMELSLIGLQNAGKTSLVNVLTTGSFHEDMIPTVGFNMRKASAGVGAWAELGGWLGGVGRFSRRAGRQGGRREGGGARASAPSPPPVHAPHTPRRFLPRPSFMAWPRPGDQGGRDHQAVGPGRPGALPQHVGAVSLGQIPRPGGGALPCAPAQRGVCCVRVLACVRACVRVARGARVRGRFAGVPRTWVLHSARPFLTLTPRPPPLPNRAQLLPRRAGDRVCGGLC